MNKITAKAILGELLEAYEECEHGDYFYDHGDSVCNAVECVLREQPRWISVEEDLPDEFVWVQVFRNSDKLMNTDFRTPVRMSGWCHYSNITHWMPLPEPPTEEEV